MQRKLIKKKIIISAIALALVLAVIIGLALLPAMRGKAPDSSTEVITELITGAVERGNVSRSLIAGGTIADVDSVSVSLTGDIKLSRWEVNEGDYVQAGDLLAGVDRQSVLVAIEDLTALIKTLDADIESHRYDTVSSFITAPRAGRVKAVYAEVGTDVSDTVERHGALMLISLDGLMAVDIDAPTLPLGAAVTVTLSDGSEVKGTVESLSEGVATITLPDESAAPDEHVTVSVDGQTVGDGTLYIHAELRLTGFAGTVARINTKVNAPISANQALITLENTDYTGERKALLTQRRELEDELQALITVYETGGVYASCSGRVSNINDALAEDSDDEEAPSTSAAPLSYANSGGKLMYSVSSHRNYVKLLSSSTLALSQPTVDSESGESGSLSGGASDTPTVANEFIGRVTEITDNGDGTKTFTVVSSTAQTKLDSAELAALSTPIEADNISVGDILVLKYENSVLVSVSIYSSGSAPEGGGDVPGSTDGAQAGGMSGGGMAGGGMSGGAGVSGTEDAQQDYTVESTVLCTLTPYERADIIITVDELDIRAISVGQEFTVTLDALSGQSFTGTVSEIDPVGENNGGSTKYAVTLSIDRAENMLTGMNAAVRTPLESREGVLIIPAAALNEDTDGTFVYTSYNARDDALGSPVYVTTGLSDGEIVEIISGMSEGDEYYYRYASEIKYTFTMR